MTTTTSKLPNIVSDIVIVQAYESIIAGKLNVNNIGANTGAIGLNYILFNDYLNKNIPTWLSLDKTKDKTSIDFTCDALGLSAGFYLSGMLMKDPDTLKNALIKGGTVSLVKLIVRTMNEPATSEK